VADRITSQYFKTGGNAMTNEDAVNLALFVLHHASPDEKSLKAGVILQLAMDPNLRGFWTQKEIDLPWGDQTLQAPFAAQFARKLGAHVRDTARGSRIVDGTANGWKLGPAAGLKLTEFVPSLRAPSTTQHLGLAGEYAVMSELLALDWSVAKPPFDNGIDLFATQAANIRTVQVKTAKLKKLGDGVMAFSGSLDSLTLYNNVSHYYVLVFRLIAGTRWQNTYYICRSSEFSQLLHALGTLDHERKKWTLHVHRANGRFLIAGSRDITNELDRFESRFL